MQNLSSISLQDLQEQLGCQLIADLLQGIPVAETELEAALRDERHPLAVNLQTAVSLAMAADRKLSRQIVIKALVKALKEDKCQDL